MAGPKSFVVVSNDARTGTGGWLVVRAYDILHALQTFLREHPGDHVYKIAELTPDGREMGRLTMTDYPVESRRS